MKLFKGGKKVKNKAKKENATSSIKPKSKKTKKFKFLSHRENGDEKKPIVMKTLKCLEE